MPATPERLKHLPKPMLSYLRSASGGDWDRVVLDGPMSAMVLNQAPVLTPPPPAPPREKGPTRIDGLPGAIRIPTAKDVEEFHRKKQQKAEEAEREKKRQHEEELRRTSGWTPEGRARHKLEVRKKAEAVVPMAPTVHHDRRAAERPDRAVPFERPARQSAPKVYDAPKNAVFSSATGHASHSERYEDTPEFDKAVEEAKITGYQHVERYRSGLPERIPVQIHPDVLALYGLDDALAQSAIRNPQRVELDTTFKKRTYPVLRFWRGDLYVVLGFKTPTKPMVVAVYVTNHDYEAQAGAGTSKGATTGGGGARRSSGLPTTPKASISRLQSEGAMIEWSETDGSRTATVTFEGQDLGKITVERVARAQVQSDYQRCLRRMQALRRRKETTA